MPKNQRLYLCTGLHKYPDTAIHTYVFPTLTKAKTFCALAQAVDSFADINWDISAVHMLAIDAALQHMEATVMACAEADARQNHR